MARAQITDRASNLIVSTKQLGEVPYLEVSVAEPARTILYVHGGPDIPTLDAPTNFDRYLASRFNARVIKPAYYGSSERSPWARPPSVDLEGASKEEAAKQLLLAIRKSYSGMPRAVNEVRRFILHWNSPSTVIIGESTGAIIATLGSQIKHQGKLMLIAPMLATYREIVNAALTGEYKNFSPVEEPQVVLGGRDVVTELFESPVERRRLQEALSLAYYAPWEDVDLGTMLRSVPGRVTVVVGLKDRVGMVAGDEWQRLRANAPATTSLCIDPNLAHEWPNAGTASLHCFEAAMLAGDPSIAPGVSRKRR